LFSFKLAIVAFIVALFAFAATSYALSANGAVGSIGSLDEDDDYDDENDQDDDDEDEEDDEDDEDDEDEDEDCELAYVNGTVTAWIFDDDEDEDDDEDDVDDDSEAMRPSYFVIDDEIYVEFGPWWYWSVGTPNVTSVVHEGDEVNVTGEIVQDGNLTIICAWTIENLTTGEKLTIKGEGAPSWAGGPKAFGIDPWPPY
jgi:hypothetical protein